MVGLEQPDGGYYMPLFVVPADAEHDPDALREAAREAIRAQLSPRHVPDEIIITPAIPRTLTGKKLEVPVKRILAGAAVEAVAAPGAVDNPRRWAGSSSSREPGAGPSVELVPQPSSSASTECDCGSRATATARRCCSSTASGRH